MFAAFAPIENLRASHSYFFLLLFCGLNPSAVRREQPLLFPAPNEKIVLSTYSIPTASPRREWLRGLPNGLWNPTRFGRNNNAKNPLPQFCAAPKIEN